MSSAKVICSSSGAPGQSLPIAKKKVRFENFPILPRRTTSRTRAELVFHYSPIDRRTGHPEGYPGPVRSLSNVQLLHVAVGDFRRGRCQDVSRYTLVFSLFESTKFLEDRREAVVDVTHIDRNVPPPGQCHTVIGACVVARLPGPRLPLVGP